MSEKSKKSSRVFLKNFDRLIKKRKMAPYDIASGLMYVLGQEFDKFLTFKSLANVEDEEFVKTKIAKAVTNELNKKTPFHAAVRNYLITDAEESGLMTITRELLAARANEPDEELSDDEYTAACKKEKNREEKYLEECKILTEVFRMLNQYYNDTGNFVREECYRRIGDSDAEE